MNNKFFLLMTVLLGILSLSISEARIMDLSSGSTIGAPSWSVPIPVKNHQSIGQRMAFRGTASGRNGNSQPGKISENQSPLPQDRLLLPKQDTNQKIKRGKGQPDGEEMIFDRWGNL
ncbi:MAG: hypothetical protein M1511_15970 [Deltaproteobacteria bacterium]|nr:hypothetical protein [Deltaproteobacteria bacterium]